MTQLLGLLLGSWWISGILFWLLFAFGTGPMVLFYFAWKIHRNIGRIADSLEVRERGMQTSEIPPPFAAFNPDPEAPSGVRNSMFAR